MLIRRPCFPLSFTSSSFYTLSASTCFMGFLECWGDNFDGDIPFVTEWSKISQFLHLCITSDCGSLHFFPSMTVGSFCDEGYARLWILSLAWAACAHYYPVYIYTWWQLLPHGLINITNEKHESVLSKHWAVLFSLQIFSLFAPNINFMKRFKSQPSSFNAQGEKKRSNEVDHCYVWPMYSSSHLCFSIFHFKLGRLIAFTLACFLLHNHPDWNTIWSFRT